MAASPSKAAINAYITRTLKAIQRKHGGTISTVLGAKVLSSSDAPDADRVCFAVTVNVLRASNGEVAFVPSYKLWDADHRSVEQTYPGLFNSLEQSLASFKAKRDGKLVFATVNRAVAGATVPVASLLCLSHDLLNPRRTQIANGNRPDIVEAVQDGDHITIIREIPYSGYEANEALKKKHGADCFAEAEQSMIYGRPAA